MCYSEDTAEKLAVALIEERVAFDVSLGSWDAGDGMARSTWVFRVEHRDLDALVHAYRQVS